MAFLRKYGGLLVLVQVIALLLGQKGFLDQVRATGVFNDLAQAKTWHWVAAGSVALVAILMLRHRGRRQREELARQDVGTE